MRLKLSVLMAAAFVVSVMAIAPASAGTASISIDSVGDRKIKDGAVSGTLFGKTLVQGTAVPGAAAPQPPTPQALVADAGDSGFAPVGASITLLGAGFGGEAPYSFAWTTEAGTLSGADGATAVIGTTGVTPGTYSATLTVTDRNGTTATDTVKFVVAPTQETTFLDESRLDPTPGVLLLGAPGTLNFRFDVQRPTAKLVVDLSWLIIANDYDLTVFAPNGVQAGRSASGFPDDPVERATIDTASQTGTWTVVVEKFATAADEVTVKVTGLVSAIEDPRPSVTSGGPYKFAVGAAQPIAGTVSGGTAPVAVGWDTDLNGLLDVSGTSFTGSFGEGRRLLSIKATDANGLERRETTSVFVVDPSRTTAETTPITVVAINDSGVNPYHLEFSAETYPDPDVLALTANFTKHPSEYIPGYPKDSVPIRATLGQGYFPAADAKLWDLRSAASPNGLEFGKLYWIPGTKIVGAIQPGVLSCANCAAGSHVILDDDGHGSGSASVSVGNRYGYCPTCLLVVTKGLNADVVAQYGWVDINSNSWGTIANAPLDFAEQLGGNDPGRGTRRAVERGQTVLFAAGNGTANAFESISPTYGTSTTGPDWNVVVGAIRRDNERAIVGEGTPAHLSAWGDGNLPSACRTGTFSQCAFSGTSAATPYTAGVFGNVLTEIRRRIADTGVGQRDGQVVAQGFSVGGTYLADGKLTRAELRDAVLKTAFPLNQDNTQTIPIFPYPLTAPYNGDINVLFEGYGAATPNSAKRAINVLLGNAPLPVREAEDRWFAIDRQIRDSLWGGYDRDADGNTDSAAPVNAFGITPTDVASVQSMLFAIRKVTDGIAAASLTQMTGANSLTYWLHRSSEGEPQLADSCANGVTYMDQSNSTGDWEPCFSNRATSVPAAYRPLGIWPSSTDLTVAIPAGSTVEVELYIASDQVTVARPNGVLMAGDRVIGEGAGTPTPLIGSGPWISQGAPIVISPLPSGVTINQNKCRELGELCWNKLAWSFTTTRHAIPGEQITFQVQTIGIRASAFGYEGAHASKVTITPAAIPGGELDFGATVAEPTEGGTLPDNTPYSATGFATFPALGTTEAGDHPTRKRVDVSVDDASFASPTEATLTLNADETSGSWSAPMAGLAPGSHTLYVRACIDRNCSATSQRTFTVEDVNTSPRVQWQVVPAGASPATDGWRAANGVLFYSFELDTRAYGKGDFDIHTRLLEGGAPTAATKVTAKFR